MNVDYKYIFNPEGQDKWSMTVEGKPEIFGIIEKEWSEKKMMQIFSIKYYWNKVFQDKKYADTIEEAKEKLKNILAQVDNQVKHMNTTFEAFLFGDAWDEPTPGTPEWNDYHNVSHPVEQSNVHKDLLEDETFMRMIRFREPYDYHRFEDFLKDTNFTEEDRQAYDWQDIRKLFQKWLEEQDSENNKNI